MLASEIFRLVFGFVAVLGMIGLAALAAQKAGLASMNGAGGRKRRLALREVLPIDARRRIAIVKCDDTEYLIMLGPTGETVVDSNLKSVPDNEVSGIDQVNPFANSMDSISNSATKLRSAGKNAA